MNAILRAARQRFFAAFVFVPLLAPVPPAKAQTNNILLLIADDLGTDSIDLCNTTNTGAHFPPTPNLDQLGRSGVLFTHFYAHPSCSASRACIITGRNSYRTGVGVAITTTNLTPALRPSEYTLSRAFMTNAPNYSVASFGKWHLADQNDVNSPLTTGGWTNFAGYMGEQVNDYTNWTKCVNGVVVSTNVTNYATSEQVNDASAFIQSRGTNLWFVWLAFSAPHPPMNKPPTNLAPDYASLSGTAADITTNGRPYFEAMMQAMDTEIGRLLTVVPPNTDIIFLGDNGTELPYQQPPYKVASVPATTNGMGHAKFTIYEGGVRVPLFITGPDVINGGRTNDSLVNEEDLFQTIQELAGINVTATLPANVIIDSRSLLPALKGDVLLPNNFIFDEQFNYHTINDGVSLRNTRFKLLHFYSHVEEFYDLANDPYEYTNLFSAALTPAAQSNVYSLKLNLSPYQTLANTASTRNLLPAPVVLGVAWSNNTFSVNEQFTQLSTNGFFANANQPGPTELALGGTNLNYNLILWRVPDLVSPLGWTPVATNFVTGVTNNFLLTTNGLLKDAGANASQYFYQVAPYIP